VTSREVVAQHEAARHGLPGKHFLQEEQAPAVAAQIATYN
jgi:hypothetical protein